MDLDGWAEEEVPPPTDADAPPQYDAPFYMADVRMDDHPDAPPDADAPTDAAPPVDASRPAATRDAGAALADAAARPAGVATLKIGAQPWGEVFVDGVKQKNRAPGTFPVTAGKHVVEVVFPEADPPRKQRFTVDLAPDQTTELFAELN